ncbi:hypothetical protein BYT27DRAFT_7215423 [Phlegmacium glaucopus]|nr:hypothetical protein BYT27DRAFT_7215423 [Phlegmacium glaucopus]
MASTIDHNRLQGTSNWIPEGYVLIIGPDDKEYVVPEFMVPALHQMFDGYRKKVDLDVFRGAGSCPSEAWVHYAGTLGTVTPSMPVHDFNSPNFNVIGEGKVMAPTIPGTSDRERLSAHAEVLALQQRLGISYKDASHHLYISELERMKSDEKMYKAFANLQASTEQALRTAYKSVRNIDGTPSDTAPSQSKE